MDDNNPAPNKFRWRPGTTIVPLLLIALGLLLLLDTLGLLDRSVWEIILSLWPLIFIALGLDALFRKKEIFAPIFWIGLGGVFLLSNYDLLGWDTWSKIFRLWPLLLVIAGLEILFGKRTIWLSIIMTVVILVTLSLVLGLTTISMPGQTTTETTIEEPLGTTEKADVTFSMGVGELNLFPLKDSNYLVAGEISSDGAIVQSETTIQENMISYSLENSSITIADLEKSRQWNLGLTSLIPIKLKSSIGVGSMDLIADDLMLEELIIEHGVSEVDLSLPESDYFVDINQAIGQLIIEIPDDLPVCFKINRGISSISVPSDFDKHDNFYCTPGTYVSNEFMYIEINQAIGIVVIRYKE